MFKRNFQILALLLLLPLWSFGQSLTLSTGGNTSSNQVSTFSLEGGRVAVNSSGIRFLSTSQAVSGYLGYGISPDLTTVGVLNKGAGGSTATLFTASGDTLARFSVTRLSANDPSISIYPVNTGGALVRDNIANFNLYDSFGKIITNVSSSSQTKGGQAISEVAMDPQAKTIVIYNPKVKRSGQLGSQVQVLGPDHHLNSIYFSTKRYIKDLQVSDDGQFIVIITKNSGSNDQLILLDRYGNKLNEISTEEKLLGSRLSEGATYLTAWSKGRVLVYNTLSGKREGSASFRTSPVVLADFYSKDHIILAMTGNYSSRSGIVNNVQFHGVDLAKRKIAHKDFGGAIGLNRSIRHKIVRTGSNHYELRGANKQVSIRASF